MAATARKLWRAEAPGISLPNRFGGFTHPESFRDRDGLLIGTNVTIQRRVDDVRIVSHLYPDSVFFGVHEQQYDSAGQRECPDHWRDEVAVGGLEVHS